MPSAVIVDQYSALSHKELVGQVNDPSTAVRFTPTWVPETERRRLAAYLVRAAYIANVARLTLPDATTTEDRRVHREYGDPAMLVDRVVAAVLGDGWSIVVDGADDNLADAPVLPPRPDDAPDGADELVRRLAVGRLKVWQAEVDAALTRWEAAIDAQPTARMLQGELRDWAGRVQLASHLVEAEHDAVGLGDTLITLWPRQGDWPSVAVYDPDSYFPVLGDDATGQYPTKIHAAWEFTEVDAGVTRRFVRRLTWELIPVTSAHVVTGLDGAPEWDGGTGPLLADGEHMADGVVTRAMPWHGEDDEPADVTCWFSDGTWELTAVTAGKAYALDPERAAWWDNPGADLGIDFLPVVHIPNTPAGKTHFGTSILDGVAQVFDDVAQSDTDVMAASGYLGSPTIALSGATADEDVVAPGRVFSVGEKGRMDVLDLSAGLVALMSASDRLQDRAWQNAGVPREIVGRADSDASSGVHLALKLAPYAQLVAMLRLPREGKYPLLLRFAAKMAMAAGAIEATPLPRARLNFGAFLPTDRSETATIVAEALNAHAISTQTGVAMLVAAGFPIDDARAEVARIRSENPTAARDLADAVGSEAAAAEWMGVEIPVAPAPVINLP